MSVEKLLKQLKEIDEVREKYPQITILKGNNNCLTIH